MAMWSYSRACPIAEPQRSTFAIIACLAMPLVLDTLKEFHKVYSKMTNKMALDILSSSDISSHSQDSLPTPEKRKYVFRLKGRLRSQNTKIHGSQITRGQACRSCKNITEEEEKEDQEHSVGYPSYKKHVQS